MRVNNASAAAESATPLAQRMLASTSKGESVPAVLMLEDGTVFYGRGCGAKGSAVGEVCFNTSLEGYFEVLTDPSYAGQIQREHDRMNGQMGRWSNARGTGREIQARRTA